MRAIREGKNDADILILYPTIWNRSAELRKIRFSIMSQKYRSVYRDLNCIYIEANLPPPKKLTSCLHTHQTHTL